MFTNHDPENWHKLSTRQRFELVCDLLATLVVGAILLAITFWPITFALLLLAKYSR